MAFFYDEDEEDDKQIKIEGPNDYDCFGFGYGGLQKDVEEKEEETIVYMEDDGDEGTEKEEDDDGIPGKDDERNETEGNDANSKSATRVPKTESNPSSNQQTPLTSPSPPPSKTTTTTTSSSGTSKSTALPCDMSTLKRTFTTRCNNLTSRACEAVKSTRMPLVMVMMNPTNGEVTFCGSDPVMMGLAFDTDYKRMLNTYYTKLSTNTKFRRKYLSGVASPMIYTTKVTPEAMTGFEEDCKMYFPDKESLDKAMSIYFPNSKAGKRAGAVVPEDDEDDEAEEPTNDTSLDGHSNSVQHDLNGGGGVSTSSGSSSKKSTQSTLTINGASLGVGSNKRSPSSSSSTTSTTTSRSQNGPRSNVRKSTLTEEEKRAERNRRKRELRRLKKEALLRQQQQ